MLSSVISGAAEDRSYCINRTGRPADSLQAIGLRAGRAPRDGLPQHAAHEHAVGKRIRHRDLQVFLQLAVELPNAFGKGRALPAFGQMEVQFHRTLAAAGEQEILRARARRACPCDAAGTQIQIYRLRRRLGVSRCVDDGRTSWP